MTAAAAPLSEPEVLAHTKRRLFPETEVRQGYAVTDTQFAMDEWALQEPLARFR